MTDAEISSVDANLSVIRFWSSTLVCSSLAIARFISPIGQPPATPTCVRGCATLGPERFHRVDTAEAHHTAATCTQSRMMAASRP
jgi:hypothetical protein